jgi:hypothetical protein
VVTVHRVCEDKDKKSGEKMNGGYSSPETWKATYLDFRTAVVTRNVLVMKHKIRQVMEREGKNMIDKKESKTEK